MNTDAFAADLTRAILARTSGSPCRRLEDLACAFVDGELEPPQVGVVQAHLEHCPACSALVAALSASTQALASFGAADPGPWFTQRVLVATVHAARRKVPDGIDRRGLWSRLLHRPRICLEAAYLGTAAGLMGFYLPLPPVPRVPALVRPLEASAQRVAEDVALAGRRTKVSLTTALVPVGTVHRVENLGRRWYAKGREALRTLKPAEGSATKAKGERNP